MAPHGLDDKVPFFWKVADKLRVTFKQREYGSVMLSRAQGVTGRVVPQLRSPGSGAISRRGIGRESGGVDGPHHDAVPEPLGPVIAESEPLIEPPSPVVKE